MPLIFSRPITIDQEWAGLLSGLCMNVPNSRWAGITSPELNVGVISHHNLNQEIKRYFQLKLKEEKGIYNAMWCDVVLLYADESHPTFAHFHLPYTALADPTNNTAINNHLVLGVEDGADNAGKAAANVKVRRVTPQTIYKSTDKLACVMLKPNEKGEMVGGWHIDPIPHTGGYNQFTVNMTNMEEHAMKDADGNICFHKMFHWLLPIIGMKNVPFYEFVLSRMWNYMIHIMKNEGYKPRFYNPQGGITITADHVAHCFGCQLCHGRKGMPLIVN
jgi:hypothetical protein